MALLSDLWSKATTSLPLIKISKWDVMVLKGQAPKRKSDNKISELIRKAEQGVSYIQDAVAGIFQGSTDKYETIARFDSFISFSGTRDSKIVHNAVERGSFRAVNKIHNPNTCVVELAKGGYRSEVEACLEALKKVNESLLICRVVTPFGYMDNLNMIGLDYNYSRDNGSNLLIAKMKFQEIRSSSVKEGSTLVKVKKPDDADTSNTGTKAAKEK